MAAMSQEQHFNFGSIKECQGDRGCVSRVSAFLENGGLSATVAIAGIGVDIIEVERVERTLTRLVTGDRFRQRVFTESEIAYCD